MLSVYLAGEIHSNWREEIIQMSEKKLDVNISKPMIGEVFDLANLPKTYWGSC